MAVAVVAAAKARRFDKQATSAASGSLSFSGSGDGGGGDGGGDGGGGGEWGGPLRVKRAAARKGARAFGSREPATWINKQASERAA